ncbi:transposase, partial [bacterium]|nr:transposase [bacterium]
LSFLWKTVRLKDGIPGVVMAIHTFGEYPEKFHPHIHAIVTDGLFTDKGLFHVMKRVDQLSLPEIYSSKTAKVC